jgi:hypothetical protein
LLKVLGGLVSGNCELGTVGISNLALMLSLDMMHPMPEVLRIQGYRFFFFSREGAEPHHIHVEQAERYAKFWLMPISLAESRGFRSSELRDLHNLVERHRESFILKWDEHFGQ